MNTPVSYLQEGGFTMYPILCFGLLGVALALASLASLLATSRKLPLGLGIAAILIALMTLGTGVLGTMMGRRTTEQAIVNADPVFAEELRARGYEESDNNLVLGGLASAAPLLAGVVAVLRGATMKPRRAQAD